MMIGFALMVKGGEDKMSDAPTQKQEEYAKYLAERMCEDLPEEYTKAAYSAFISRWKPIVKAEDDAMNDPSAWQWQYS